MQAVRRAKRLASVMFPRAYRGLRRLRGGVHERVARIAREVAPDGRVVTGPFRGMRYVMTSVWEANYLPKLLGTYEAELHEVVEGLTGYRTVLNVGSAEGYYAVGMALRLPEATVYAFDIEPASRVLVRRMARMNGVAGRVRTGGAIACADLGGLIRDADAPVLVLMDIEGAEMDVLGLEGAPALGAADILLELHDTEAVLDRFAASHETTIVEPDEPPACPVPLTPHDAAFAVDEGRPWPPRWAMMRAHVTAPAG